MSLIHVLQMMITIYWFVTTISSDLITQLIPRKAKLKENRLMSSISLKVLSIHGLPPIPFYNLLCMSVCLCMSVGINKISLIILVVFGVQKKTLLTLLTFPVDTVIINVGNLYMGNLVYLTINDWLEIWWRDEKSHLTLITIFIFLKDLI